MFGKKHNNRLTGRDDEKTVNSAGRGALHSAHGAEGNWHHARVGVQEAQLLQQPCGGLLIDRHLLRGHHILVNLGGVLQSGWLVDFSCLN